MSDGFYGADFSTEDIEMIDSGTEKILIEKAQSGDKESRDRLIMANMKLVFDIARKYVNEHSQQEDLISGGCMGIMRAIEGYNPTKGSKFSSWAGTWIRKFMQDIAFEGSEIPSYISYLVGKWLRYVNGYVADKGYKPSNEEVKEALELTDGQVKGIMFALNNEHNLRIDYSGRNEDEHIDVEDENADNPLDVCSQKQLVELIDENLDLLKPREKQVIIRIYGLRNNPAESMEEIAKTFDVSKEMIRVISRDALEKLKFRLQKKV